MKGLGYKAWIIKLITVHIFQYGFVKQFLEVNFNENIQSTEKEEMQKEYNDIIQIINEIAEEINSILSNRDKKGISKG